MRWEHMFVTSQGSAHGRFTRAIAQRHVWNAETAARELGDVSLADALELVLLYAHAGDPKYERAAVRWLGRLCKERRLTLADAQLAAAALAVARDGVARNAPEILRRLARGS